MSNVLQGLSDLLSLIPVIIEAVLGNVYLRLLYIGLPLFGICIALVKSITAGKGE